MGIMAGAVIGAVAGIWSGILYIVEVAGVTLYGQLAFTATKTIPNLWIPCNVGGARYARLMTTQDCAIQDTTPKK